MGRLTTLKPRIATLGDRLPASAEQSAYGQGRGGRPWRRLRAQVLKRDGFMCQCENCQGRVLIAHEVDHITPVFEGGTDDLSNLRAINRDCHSVKTQAEAKRARG